MSSLLVRALTGAMIGGVVGALLGVGITILFVVAGAAALAYAAPGPGRGLNFGPLIGYPALVGACVGLLWSVLFPASASAVDPASDRRGTIVQAVLLALLVAASVWYLVIRSD